MVILRPTRKLLQFLPCSAGENFLSDTALGDWYVNRIVIDRKPLLILLSSRSLLSIVLSARGVRFIPRRLPELVAARLERLGVSAALIEAEITAMSPVHVAKTTDRSVLGVLVDFSRLVPLYFGAGRWDEVSLSMAENRLAETPCYASRRLEDTIFPEKKAAELLSARWRTGEKAVTG